MLETLSEYDFVVHCPGKKHTNVDSLTCMPCSQCRLPPEEDSEHQGGGMNKRLQLVLPSKLVPAVLVYWENCITHW